MSKHTFPSDLSYVKPASDTLVEKMNSHGVGPNELIDIKLCFEEAFINAVKHGNHSRPDLKVSVEIILGHDSVEISVGDEGAGFDFENCPDPTKEEHLQRTHGRGVFLIKQFMDESSYDKNAKLLFMKKYLKK
jgi:serine/threonine-protein kinase RsbW